MIEICKRFGNKILIDINNLYFLYNGNKINLQLTYNQIVNDIDRQREMMSVLVYNINSTIVSNNKRIKSDFPICIKCKESVKLEFNEYKLNLLGCKNKHIINNILINEYDKYMDISNIECNQCKRKKYEIYNNEMYICNGCNILLCPLCKNNHNKEHKIINYDLKNYICNKHNEPFISYCNQCKINICMKCQKDHIKHNMILYGEILPDENELKKRMKELRIVINKFNDNINEIINKLNNIKNNIEILYNIYNNIIEKYNDKYINYELLMTINNINIINEIKEINYINNINNKFDKLMNIYEKMNNKYSNDEITIIYNINNEQKIKIFDETFVNNNRDKCKIIYDYDEYNLTEEFNVKNINILEIKLKGINKIINMKSMFYECSSLISLPDISNWNTMNVTKMNHLFYGCNSLKSLPDISNWNTNKVTNMKSMFSNCSALISLPDISNWNTNKVTDMKCMFYNCSALISLPDISNWNTMNVTNMESMFDGCSSLKSLPNIFKWNISKLENKINMFNNCSKSLNIPNKFK